MENRFLELDRGSTAAPIDAGAGGRRSPASPPRRWAAPFAAADRALVILIENGGVDLGIPELVDKILAVIPGGQR